MSSVNNLLDLADTASMDSIEQKLNEIERLIKGAQGETAQAHLKALRKGKALPREYLLRYSSLCRRANLPDLGLNALRAVVRPTGRLSGEKATEAEVIEYANLLIRVGACREARALLPDAHAKSSTPIIHTLAYLYVKQWNYPSAIRFFMEYIERPDLDSYAIQIGRLNLSLCLIFEEKLDQAENVAQAALALKDVGNYALVKANALRLLGMVEYFRRNYKKAMNFLAESSKTFPQSNSIDLFLNQKWVTATNYALRKGDRKAKDEVEFLKKQAKELNHWESVRDLDYLTAAFDQNEKRLIHVYFGTPFENYRKRIHKHFPNLVLPEAVMWRPSGSEKGAKSHFDLLSSSLKPGSAPHRLLSVLTSDFYHPFSMVDIFDKVFTENFYCPRSSEARVSQLIIRTRQWLKKEKINLEILSNDGRITLAEEDTSITVHLEGKGEEQDYHRLNAIRSKLGESFTVSQAAELFNCTPRTVNNLVTRALEDGVLSREGQGKNTRYQFLENKKAA